MKGDDVLPRVCAKGRLWVKSKNIFAMNVVLNIRISRTGRWKVHAHIDHHFRDITGTLRADPIWWMLKKDIERQIEFEKGKSLPVVIPGRPSLPGRQGAKEQNQSHP